LGYLSHKEELKSKPILTRKLEELGNNQTLEYYFRITSQNPKFTELVIERQAGKSQRYWLNSQETDADTIFREFDVVFLTEDDPWKVVTSTLKKLADHFRIVDNRLKELQTALSENLFAVEDYKAFKENEENLLKEIKLHKEVATDLDETRSETEILREKAIQRDKVLKTFDLLDRKNEIEEKYNVSKQKYDEIKDNQYRDLSTDLMKERFKWGNLQNEISQINSRIKRLCQLLEEYNVSLDVQKLLSNDHTQLNTITSKLAHEANQNKFNLSLVDKMLSTFEGYSKDEIVPVINKTVGQTREELNKIKNQDKSRTSDLIKSIKDALKERDENEVASERINKKIKKITDISEIIQNNEAIQKEFSDAENEYWELQKAFKENRAKLSKERTELCLIQGDPTVIQNQIEELKGEVDKEKELQQKFELKLENLRDNASAKPKYIDKEKELGQLMKTINRLKEKTPQWIEILQEPARSGDTFKSIGNKPGPFTLKDYQNFVQAVGESLGKQFEPVFFDNRLHMITFFDIQNNFFVTTESRKIKINLLSTGQEKVTALDGILNKLGQLGPQKNTIILVDEISVIDPLKIETLKNTLKKGSNNGEIFLSILLRPSSEMFEVKTW